MSGEGLIADRPEPRAIALQPRHARQGFAVLAKPDNAPWCVRVLVTGEGPGDQGDAACAPIQLDLSPSRAELLAQELMQMAELARNPGSCPE